MLNDSDLQKAAEEMLNNDAHDEVRKVMFLTVFFSKLTIYFKESPFYCVFVDYTCIYHWFNQVMLSFMSFDPSVVSSHARSIKFQEEVFIRMVS